MKKNIRKEAQVLINTDCAMKHTASPISITVNIARQDTSFNCSARITILQEAVIDMSPKSIAPESTATCLLTEKRAILPACNIGDEGKNVISNKANVNLKTGWLILIIIIENRRANSIAGQVLIFKHSANISILQITVVLIAWTCINPGPESAENPQATIN
eukprot:GFUD01099948.1.p2 GENE.GFUD01099948.1~~GFUD01099948.1.p2  ORF type:complete len:161 (-),score=32.44 GFUD01099948.1:298-780(-)